MILQDSLLVTLVKLVERLPMPVPARKRQRGHPMVYSDRLFLKALVIMIVRHLHTVHGLLSVLAQPTAEMATLRSLLSEQGHLPSRRTWERRLKAIPATLPAQIGCLGRYLIDLLQPWATCGRAVAIDSTVLRARGGVWHQKHREKGELPHTSIDPEAHWTKSGWYGWVYGWKLHVVSVVAGVWFPIAARLTPANIADNEPAPALLGEVPAEVRFVLGDRHYNTPDLHEACEQADRLLVTTKYGRYPHSDAGVEVRRLFHKLRSIAMENFNEHFKGIFEGHGQVPTKGLLATQRFALGAIFVYQLALVYRFEHDLPLCVGLKAFLKAA
ncbi:MAG TPA: transposase [Ktedonobacteraceae bacterium]|nr:transposase [Ktedonobacteraceae bacterium]